MMTQMSRTQPPPTAPPTIINIGRASVTWTEMGEKNGVGGGGVGVDGCQEKGRDQIRDRRV